MCGAQVGRRGRQRRWQAAPTSPVARRKNLSLERIGMKIKTVFVLALFVVGVGVLLPVVKSQTGGSDAVAAVTKLEHEQVDAALKNDISFTKKYLADDAIEGTSFGEWLTKDSLVADAADPAKNKTNKMAISELKVTAHGNVAVARYTNTYDDVYHGTHRARSVICSDTWVSGDGGWKLVANHCSQKK